MSKEFKVGEAIVYPLHGIGIVKGIEKKTFRDKELLYYTIHLEATDMIVMAPVDKAEELGLRAVVSAKEAQAALDFLNEEYKSAQVDWKQRYQLNLDHLKEGTILNIAKVVQGLYHRSKVKELPVQERKLYDNALKILTSESAMALKKDPKEIDRLIFAALESKHDKDEGKKEIHIEEDIEEL